MTHKIDYELRIISRQLCGIRDAMAIEEDPDRFQKALLRIHTVKPEVRQLEAALQEENERRGNNGENGTPPGEH